MEAEERLRIGPDGSCYSPTLRKKGTRRWYSMKLCGNRFKVAAYADRQRTRSRKR
jgi:predicted RNA-binding Zn ribbon-like protein